MLLEVISAPYLVLELDLGVSSFELCPVSSAVSSDEQVLFFAPLTTCTQVGCAPGQQSHCILTSLTPADSQRYRTWLARNRCSASIRLVSPLSDDEQDSCRPEEIDSHQAARSAPECELFIAFYRQALTYKDI